ncbi:MAG: hypothetical protein QXZ02_04495 [Candidatus Bathyarchaeia archaeon]
MVTTSSSIVMITAIGAKPMRVIHNIAFYHPEKVVVLKQLKEGWSEKNRAYKKNVLDKFYGHKVIKDLKKQNRLDEWPVSDLTNSEKFFRELFCLLKKYKNYDNVYIDTTAMPRMATIIATVVASLFPNAHCVASGKKGYGKYSLKKYPNPNEKGSDPVQIPLLRRDINVLMGANTLSGLVFRVIYDNFLAHMRTSDKPFEMNKSLILKCVKNKVSKNYESEKPFKQAVSNALTELTKDGWLVDRGMNNYGLSHFAVYLGPLLEEETEIKYENEALIKELIIQNEDIIRRQAHRFRTRGLKEEQIKNWLLQFPSVNSAQIALKLLERVEYIDQQKMEDFMKDFYEKLTPNEKKNAVFVILGRLGDSSDLVSYVFTHTVKDSRVLTLKEALSQDSTKTIFFLDDCLITGTQAKQIFGEWFGAVSTRKYVTKLTDTEIAKLKQLDLRLHVIVGTDEGIKGLTKYLQELGCKIDITASRLLTRESDSCFVWKSSHSIAVFDNKEEMEKAKQEFHGIGKRILRSKAKEDGWTSEQLEKNALGYNDWQLLLVFQHNVPTATLPIFWARAHLDETKWEPLFPRK